MKWLLEFIKTVENYVNEIVIGIPLYKIILSTGVFLAFLFLRKVVVTLFVRSLSRLTRKTATDLDDLLLEVLKGPVSFFMVIAGISLALLIAGVHRDFIAKAIRTLFIVALGWASMNFLRTFDHRIKEFFARFGKELSAEIGNFLVRLLKAFVLIVTGTAVLQIWGINVSAIIASLGLLGLAISLAAKDTLENIISGIVILFDRPILTGETGSIAGVEGTVEEIGLRSTKIRTFDKTLVTIPNREIVSQKIENWTRREVRRVRTYLGLTYSTSRDQVTAILQDLREMLKNHPRLSRELDFYVYFEAFGESSLNILLQYYTATADYREYLEIVEDINLKIMEIVEKNGSSFAFPSRSLYVESVPVLKVEGERKSEQQ